MGFAAEIKEFLGAAKDSWKLATDTESKDATTAYTKMKTLAEQKEMDDPLNQKLKEAKLAHMQATTGNIGKAAPLSEWQRWLMAQASKPQESSVAASAAPITISRPAASYGSDDPQEGTGYIPGAAPKKAVTPPWDPSNPGIYNRGGLVRKFAIGGVVDDEDLAPTPAPEEDELPPQAIPTSGTGLPLRRPQGAIGTPMPAPAPPELQAIRAGLKYQLTQIPQTAVPTAGRRQAIRGLAQGAGAAPVDEMTQIYKKIDPKGELSEGERNFLAMNAVYDYKSKTGDTEGAAKAAFQMMQHYKTASTRYAALSAAAVEGGHIDDGIKLALKAYANVPDGNDLKLWKSKGGQINYSVKDKNGDTIDGGLMSPQELGAAAMKLGSPGAFENHMVQMISGGGKAANMGKGKAAKEPDEGGAAQDPAKYGTTQEQIGGYVDKYIEKAKLDPKNRDKEFTDEETNRIKNAMYHIRSENKVTDDEAFRAATSFITAPEPKKGEQAPFKVTHGDGTHQIRMKDGRVIELSTSDYLPLAAARGEALAEAERKANAPKQEKFSDKADRALGHAANIGGEALEAAKIGGSAIGGAIGRAAAPVGEVIAGSVPAEAARMGIEALKRNRPDIPYNEEDRPL